MSTHIILFVLFAALLHASWNIIVKGGANKLFETGINSLGGGIGAIFFLPFLPLPARDCWLLLLASCVFHLIYYLCMAATYRISDLSTGYALMRGTAPILTALVLCFIGIPLPLGGWFALILLSSGILLLTLQKRGERNIKGIIYALRTSIFIMAYTLADGFGARLSEDSLSYTIWIFFLNMFPINFWILALHGKEYLPYLQNRAVRGIFGGFCSLASYGIAIWAMTLAPIALVAGLRETSVIFGMILAVFFLHEKLTLLRFAAIILVIGGSILSRLG